MRAGLPRRLGALAGLLGLAACAQIPWRPAPEVPRVLHPQVSRVQGEAWIQPRHAREPRPLTGPVLLEPDDRIITGPRGKVEILLPEAALRLYGATTVRVPYAFEGRTPVTRRIRVDEGEVLILRQKPGPFQVRCGAFEVDLALPSTVLVASRDRVDHVVCYRGTAEARNVAVRGQTLIRLAPGHHALLDRGASVAYLETARFPDEWRRWEGAGAVTAGIAPLPAAAGPE